MFGWSLPDLLVWTKANNLADNWSDIFGLIVTCFGFTFTLIGVFRAKHAAQLAQEAAQRTRDSIRLFETLVDFSSAITTLEEIKRFHRQKDAWPLLPDRYAATRKNLIQLRNSQIKLSEDQLSIVQNALVNLTEIEKRVEKGLANNSAINSSKFNELISSDVDGLLTILVELKAQRGEFTS